jgi:hypothetical protein
MDLYLPDDFYALSGTRKDLPDITSVPDDDMAWLGATTQVAPPDDTHRADVRVDPDPTWRAI